MSTRWRLFHPIMWLWAPDNGYSIQSCDYKHQMTVIPSNHVTMSTRWRLFHPIIYLWAQDDGYARVTSCALSSRHTFSNCSNFPSAPTYGVNYISIKRDVQDSAFSRYMIAAYKQTTYTRIHVSNIEIVTSDGLRWPPWIGW